MRATHTRFILVAALISALGACSSILPKRASEPYKNGGADSSAELAKPSVVVVIDGAKSAAVRDMVETMLADNYEVVAEKQYRKTARRLKARKMKKSHVAKVASELGADAVLHGVLRRKGKKRYKLALRLRDASGKTLERFTLTLRSRKLRKRDQRKLASRLRPVLDELTPVQQPAQQEAIAKATPAKKSEPRIAKARPAKKSEPRIAEAPARTPDDELADVPAYVEEVDDSGQVIDDEVPDILR